MRLEQRGFGYGTALLFAVLLIPFVYTAFFAFPEGDDFSYALQAKFFFDLPSGLHAMASAWWKWSGRYAHHFLTVFLGDFAEYRVSYTVLLLSFLALTWLSLFGIARELGRHAGRAQAAFMATFLLFAVLSAHGTVNEWFLHVEIMSLVGGYCGTLVYLWSLCRLWNRPVATKGTKIFCLASCVSTIGLYEHSALMVLLITLAAWQLARLYDHPHRPVFFLLVKVAAVCFLLTYLARGNFRRQAKRGMDFGLMLGQIMNAGKEWWTAVVPAFATPLYVAAVFAAAWFVPGWKTPLEKKLPAPLIVLGCLALMAAYSIGLTLVHAMSDVTVGEVRKIPVNIAQYAAVFVFFALFACRGWLRLDYLRYLGRPLSLVLVLAVLVAGNSNFFPVLWDGVCGETERYAAAYEKRKAVLREHAGETLTVMPLLYAPLAVAGDSLRSGIKSWPNKYAAPFYGLEGIETVAPSSEGAFAQAQQKGLLAWKDAGKGVRSAYVPSLALPGNATYTFDWLFLESDERQTPDVRMAVLPGKGPFAGLLTGQAMLGRIRDRSWPFRNVFDRPLPKLLHVEDGNYYAVPLPQSDSAKTGVGASTVVFVNGGRPVTAMGEERPSE